MGKPTYLEWLKQVENPTFPKVLIFGMAIYQLGITPPMKKNLRIERV